MVVEVEVVVVCRNDIGGEAEVVEDDGVVAILVCVSSLWLLG